MALSLFILERATFEEVRFKIYTMKRLFFIPPLLLILCSGCDLFGSNDEPDAVLLRVMNESTLDFSSIYVSFSEEGSLWDSVPNGKASEHHKFTIAYSYGFVEAKVDTVTYRLQPIDYVGESTLPNGYYTYKLDIVDGRLQGDIAKN